MTETQKPIVRVKDVMQKEITSIDGMATAGEAAVAMRSEKTHCLLVEKRPPDDAWGIIAIQDLIQGVIMADRTPDEVNVYEIMSKPVITVPADMDIRYVTRLLSELAYEGLRWNPMEKSLG